VSKAFGYRDHEVVSSRVFRNVVKYLLIITVSYAGTLNRHCQGSAKQLNSTSTVFTKPFSDFVYKQCLVYLAKFIEIGAVV
jgi:hypothetical protein